MSTPLEVASPTAACKPPTEARAARLKKFAREQLIVDYLNRGVSVAEIAARIGIGEKRTRAVMRDILARRMPHPPREFVAIQVSRLNEAMLVAFSAMSPTNLKAVAQVVKIVRELDRYGGAFAAEWARPEAPRLDAPAEEDAAFARAWLDGEPAVQELDAASLGRLGCARPENPAHELEKVESAPGNRPTPAVRAETGSDDPRDSFSSFAGEGGSLGRPEGRPSLDGLQRRMGCGPLIGYQSDCTTVSANPASTGELLSTPHPAFGHLPHCVEKEERP